MAEKLRAEKMGDKIFLPIIFLPKFKTFRSSEIAEQKRRIDMTAHRSKPNIGPFLRAN